MYAVRRRLELARRRLLELPRRRRLELARRRVVSLVVVLLRRQAGHSFFKAATEPRQVQEMCISGLQTVVMLVMGEYLGLSRSRRVQQRLETVAISISGVAMRLMGRVGILRFKWAPVTLGTGVTSTSTLVKQVQRDMRVAASL